MKALIFGVSGQDGAYLSQFLLNKGYEVTGTSRDAEVNTFSNLVRLDVNTNVKKLSVSINDFRSVLQAICDAEPDEVYNLSGQSSVGLSFKQPMETMESIALGVLNILEAIRFTGKNIKFYNAGSSECFGDIGNNAANEDTPFMPRSPYAVAKSAAHWEACNYREAYGIFVSNGILFNHESPLRPERFVTKKIITSACKIAHGSTEKLCLGNINIIRDWGWAPEYIEAMWKMLQMDEPDDYVIATGESYSLEEFLDCAFKYFNLDWQDHVTLDRQLIRPSDLSISRADPKKARQELQWEAKTNMHDVVNKMIKYQLDLVDQNTQ